MAQIVRAYVRHYSDNDQTTAYVEWSDGSRTEGNPTGLHMLSLLTRAAGAGKFALSPMASAGVNRVTELHNELCDARAELLSELVTETW